MKNIIQKSLDITSALVTPTLRAANCAGYSAQKQNGFTLIELLVVVLIIGILSAVALPQYKKAVEKARLSEALTNIASLQKAVDALCLADPNFSGEIIGCDDDDHPGRKCGVLDIDVESFLTCDQDDGDDCRGKHFDYDVTGHCNSDRYPTYIAVMRAKNGDVDNNDTEYELYLERNSSGEWSKYCNDNSDYPYSTAICQSLDAQGWNYYD